MGSTLAMAGLAGGGWGGLGAWLDMDMLLLVVITFLLILVKHLLMDMPHIF